VTDERATDLYCPASGRAEGEDNSTHHLIPGPGSAQVCRYCRKPARTIEREWRDRSKIPTIRRDGTFEFKGVTYRVAQGSDKPTEDGSRFVERVSDLALIEDGFGYLSEIRAWLKKAVEEDWPTLEDTSPPEYGVKHYGR